MNWYKTKVANFNLGVNLGRWLILHSNGQYNPMSIQNDIMSQIANDPAGIDTMLARQTAINFFQNNLKYQPDNQQLQMLDEWLQMVDGSLNTNLMINNGENLNAYENL